MPQIPKINVPVWIPLTNDRVEDLTSIVPDPSFYAWKPGAEAPDWVPFKPKLVDMICLRSDTASGFFFMADFRRLDRDPRTGLWVLDQEPFLLAVLPTTSLSLSSGVYIHHGDWRGRTQIIPTEVVSAFLGTPVASLYPLPQAPPSTYGPISELERSTWAEAFRVGLKRLAGEERGVPHGGRTQARQAFRG